MPKKALISWGGWPGHHPKECADLFTQWLDKNAYDVTVRDDLDCYADAELMASIDLIVPIWTMAEISNDQVKGLCEAVNKGAGLAGFHGGMGDSFRGNTAYQFMVGGQFVDHIGGCIPSYDIEIIDHDHPVTSGIGNFTMLDTEQYYMHVDPSNNVLAQTTCRNGTVMPAVWTRPYGAGKVFYASWGHTPKDFEIPEALEIVTRGMVWATR